MSTIASDVGMVVNMLHICLVNVFKINKYSVYYWQLKDLLNEPSSYKEIQIEAAKKWAEECSLKITELHASEMHSINVLLWTYLCSSFTYDMYWFQRTSLCPILGHWKKKKIIILWIRDAALGESLGKIVKNTLCVFYSYIHFLCVLNILYHCKYLLLCMCICVCKCMNMCVNICVKNSLCILLHV